MNGWVLARTAAAAPLVVGLILLTAPPAAAQEAEIASVGPLTRIIVSTELNCQVAHRDDATFELFPSDSTTGACGTFLALDDLLYGPSSVPAGLSPTVAWTPVSQSAPSGAGSASDPLRIVTVVDAAGAELRLEQTDSYVVGSQSYRTDIRILNAGAAPRTGILYRAGDCYLQESDTGFGRVDDGAPACVIAPGEGSRIEQWLPLTPGSTYIEGAFGDVWAAVSSRQLFPNTCRCDEELDNGAGLSWPVSIGAGQSVVISHDTFFSPVGRGPAEQSFRASVPDPLSISLDPIIIAQSVAITAGVILLVPFPSALFNSTLEENYDEVMAGVAKVKAWLGGMSAAVAGFVRRQVDARRGRGPAPPAGGDAAPPLLAPVAVEPEPAAVAVAPERDLWRTPQGIIGFVALTALLYAFLDPTFGFSLLSLATLAGLFIGLLIVLVAYGLPLVIATRRRGVPTSVRALPATLVVGIGCVIISRLADFQPGYLYGLVIGFLFARNIDLRVEGRAEAIAAAASLGVAIVAWVSLAFVRAGGGGEELTMALFEAAAVTTVVAGLENAVFAMLPLRFLPGAAVLAWNRRVWLVLMALGLFGFAHVLLNPSAGYLADSTRTSLLTMIALLVVFALASVAFWAWFRYRPSRAPAR